MTVVNLNRARKAKAKAETAETAVRNRAVHGLTRAEKAAAKTAREATERRLDGARRET